VKVVIYLILIMLNIKVFFFFVNEGFGDTLGFLDLWSIDYFYC